MMTEFDPKQDDVLEAMESNYWEVSEDQTQGRREGGEWMPIAEASAAFIVWHRENYEPRGDSEAWSGGFASNH